jgi:hypothetical protein
MKSKYKVGDRVFPIAKSRGVPFHNSHTVELALRNGYTTICFIKNEHTDQIFYSCEPGGGEFSEQDLVPCTNRGCIHLLKKP